MFHDGLAALGVFHQPRLGPAEAGNVSMLLSVLADVTQDGMSA